MRGCYKCFILSNFHTSQHTFQQHALTIRDKKPALLAWSRHLLHFSCGRWRYFMGFKWGAFSLHFESCLEPQKNVIFSFIRQYISSTAISTLSNLSSLPSNKSLINAMVNLTGFLWPTVFFVARSSYELCYRQILEQQEKVRLSCDGRF